MLTFLTTLTLLVPLQDQDPFQEIEKLRREVSTLRTLSKIQLTHDQMKQIVKLWDDGVEQRKKIAEEYSEALVNLKNALVKLRDALLEGSTDTADLSRKVEEIQRQTGRAMGPVFRTYRKNNEALRKIITDEQLDQIAAFGRRDPAAGVKALVERTMDRMRGRQNVDLDRLIGENIFGQIERLSRGMKLSDDKINNEVDRILDIMDEGISSKAEDYKEKRSELLRRIYEEGKLAEAIKRVQPPKGSGRKRAIQRLGYTFMNPLVINALRKRIGE